ncbi:MAG TPA: PDZ domain-containing protein [bacterium]
MTKLFTALSKAIVCLSVSKLIIAGGIAPPPVMESGDRLRINPERREAIERTGYLGIATKTCENGVIIEYIDPEGPAAKAGFKFGDIVTIIDDQKIDNNETFRDYMNSSVAGQKLTMTVLRKDAEIVLTATLDPVSPLTIRFKLGQMLGESWRVKANAALERGDYENAIKYYETWLYADPQDKKSWYCLACAYAMIGNREKCLNAWEYAIDAGWEDSKYPPQDENLKLIRDDERFVNGLQRCERNKLLNKPKNYIRNYVEMPSLGTYITLLPPDYDVSKEKYPLCLILHGGGSTEIDYGMLADNVGRDGVIYIVPRYPYPHTDQFMDERKEGWTASPPYDLDKDTSWFKVINDFNIEWIFACAADTRKRYRVSGSEVFMIGHCAGATIANECAIRHPELVRSYFAYAGAFPDFCVDAKALGGLKKHKVKPYLAHCSGDQLIDPEESMKAERVMKQAGIDCVLRIFDANHYVSGDVYSFMKEWVDTEMRMIKN